MTTKTLFLLLVVAITLAWLAVFLITHHSCAFNADRFSYDAGGVEVDYKVWAR